MSTQFTYRTDGSVCSESIDISISGGRIESVHFNGGCPGNLLGIGVLVKGKTPEEIISLFSGLPCGGKSTSCPDQLARALKEYLAKC